MNINEVIGLLENDFKMIESEFKQKDLKRFFVRTNDVFFFCVNINGKRQSIQYGITLTRKDDNLSKVYEGGFNTNMFSERNELYFTGIEDINQLKKVLSKALFAYSNYSRNDIIHNIDSKRTAFIMAIDSKLKSFGFVRDGSNWYLETSEHYSINVCLSKSKWVDDYELLLFLMNSRTPKFEYIRENLRVFNDKYIDWQLDSKAFFNDLDIFIEEYIKLVIEEDVSELSIYRNYDCDAPLIKLVEGNGDSIFSRVTSNKIVACFLLILYILSGVLLISSILGHNLLIPLFISILITFFATYKVISST